MVFFFDLRILARKVAGPFGHSMQVGSRYASSTCVHLRLLPVCLARALKYGDEVSLPEHLTLCAVIPTCADY